MNTHAQTEPTYTLFAVFRISSSHPVEWDGSDVPHVVQELVDVVSLLGDEGTQLRGWYDVSGMRSDADLMVWLHSSSASDLQWAIRQLRRTKLLRPLIRVWSALGVHRTGEVDLPQAPGFARDEMARDWVTVLPFVRAPEWQQLDPADRSAAVTTLGGAATEFPGVVANTVSAFGLGEYDWLVPMESDSLEELVDLARDLRSLDAQGRMSAHTPRSYIGRRIEPVEIVEVLQ